MIKGIAHRQDLDSDVRPSLISLLIKLSHFDTSWALEYFEGFITSLWNIVTASSLVISNSRRLITNDSCVKEL